MVTVSHQCSCGSHKINISAVNRCGSPGESTLSIVEDEISTSQLLANMESQGAGVNSECQGIN